MGQPRIATCPECGDLFPIGDGLSITTKDGTALLACKVDCLLDIWRRENPTPGEAEPAPPEGKTGYPWPEE